MRLIQFLLRTIFYLLYHQFAWTYDLVANLVSLGQWQNWIQVSLPYLGGRVLEIGFGPGHLQVCLGEKEIPIFGLDESHQMALQASRRLHKNGVASRLSRGYAQHIPFAGGIFDSVVSTFPSEFIFDPNSLLEIKRVLNPAGRLIILPMAWITGKRAFEKLAAWLLRATGEAPGEPGSISSALSDRFTQVGLLARSEIVDLKGSQVLVIVAEKIPGADLE